MGISKEYGMGTLRISMGRYTTEEDIKKAVDFIYEAVNSFVLSHNIH